MRFIVLTLIGLIFLQFTYASKIDTVAIQLLNERSTKIVSCNPDSGLIYARVALQYSKQINNKPGHISALNNIGYAHLFLSNYDSALLYFKEMNRNIDGIKNPQFVANGFYSIAQVHYYMGDYDSALLNYKLSLDEFTLLEDVGGMAKCYYDIGYIQYDWGRYDKAYESFQHGLQYTEKLPDQKAIQTSLHNGLGHVLSKLGRDDEALSHYVKAKQLNLELNDMYGLAHTYNNIGNIYNTIGSFDSSLFYYEEARKMFCETSNLNGEAMAWHNLGLVSIEQGDYDKALNYINKSLEINEEIEHPAGICDSWNDIGSLLITLGRYDEAYHAINRSQELAMEIGLGEVIYDNYYNLHLYYDSIGMADKALDFHRKYIDVRDSIINLSTHEEIAMLEARFDQERLEKQMELLSKENELNEIRVKESRYLNISLIILTCSIVLFGFLLVRQRRLSDARKNVLLERKLLRSQMNPHFIFNSLISIQGFMLKKDPRNASLYISSFSKLIRNILENSRKDFVSIDNEMGTLKYYLDLQRLRFGNKFEYSIELDESIDAEHTLIPPMLAQPFIENAIEHGIKPKNSNGHIHIRFRLNGETIVFEVEDDGVGRVKAKELEERQGRGHKSLATSITRERLSVFNRHKKNKINMDIIDLYTSDGIPAGTKVIFDIPFMINL